MRLPSEGCSGSATDRRPPECWTEVSLLPFAYQHPRLDPGGGSRIPGELSRTPLFGVCVCVCVCVCVRFGGWGNAGT